MKKTIKLFAFILAALMLVSFIPLAAFAEEIETGAENTENETAETLEEGSSEIQTGDSEGEAYTYEPAFTLPEGDENTTYELISKNIVRVTVFPNVTEAPAENNGAELAIPGKLDMVDFSDGAEQMKIGNDMVDLGGGGGIPSPTDTYISYDNPSTNYGSSAEAQVRNNKILYIKYPMPYIPEYATLLEASLKIAYVYNDPTQDVEVYVHRINISWTESGLTWNVANQNTRLGLEQRFMSSTTISDPQGISVITPQFTEFDILDAAQDWLSGEAENNGVALKTYGQLIKFKTSEALSTYRPSFEYVYSVPAPLDNGTYRIHNVETERYIDIKDASTNYGAYITQDAFNDAARQEWILNFGSDGYYTIKSVHSNKYIGLDISDLNNIKQYTSPTDYCKWAIRETTSGNYIFVCKGTDEDEYVLSAISCFSGDGSVLIGKAYTDNGDYNDEWNLGIPVRFEDIHLNVGETTTANIQAACPAGYVNVTDYRYTILDNGDEYVDINNITGAITAVDIDDDICTPDVVTVIATHKEYLLTYSFDVTVYSGNLYISIFSSYDANSGDSLENFGHAFLTFYNDTDSTLRIGLATVNPKTEISISGWGVTEHSGLWYNRDLYHTKYEHWFEDRVSLTEVISTTEELASINEYISNNDSWQLWNNCSTFAINVWNSVSSTQIDDDLIDTPKKLKERIKNISGYETQRKMQGTQYYGYYNSDEEFVCVWGTVQ